MDLRIWADGASRGNPGPAAIGVLIRDNHDRTIAEISQSIGVATNNQAEYQATIAALEAALRLKPSQVNIYLDSELVVRQISGRYKLRSPLLLPLFQKAVQLSKAIGNLDITYIPREQNENAHALAEAALQKSVPTQGAQFHKPGTKSY